MHEKKQELKILISEIKDDLKNLIKISSEINTFLKEDRLKTIDKG